MLFFCRKYNDMNRNLKISARLFRIFFVMAWLTAYASLFAESYTVKKGDTLYSLGRKFQLTVAELCTANNIDVSDVLKVGQKLVIPGADISNAAALSGSSSVPPDSSAAQETYLVQKGDTFYGIARKYNIRLSELFAMNGLGSDSVLRAGQKLFVPAEKQSNSIPDVAKTDNTDGGLDLKVADPRNYTTAKSGDSLLDWPVKNPTVTYVNGKVSGVQLSAKENESVTTVCSGTVMYCGLYRGFGHVVFVRSKTGLVYAYSGLGSVSVKKGDYLVHGDKIGKAGKDTLTNKFQMTFMIFQNGSPIDPAKAPRG